MRTTAPLLLPAGPGPIRRASARTLEAVSRGLALLARWLQTEAARPDGDAVLEFHAEADALEGALYLDGELVARIPGVTRL